MKLKLVDKKEVAKDSKAFYFEPEKEVDWTPGQYFYFTIPEKKMRYKDPKGNTHDFSLFLSPTEDKLIACATRMREGSNYKKSLDAIEIGDTIEGEGPNGEFTLDENEKGSHVLLAGGIGITPFRSMIKYNIDKGLKDIDIHLIYANSLPEDISFREDLETWAKENKNITVDMTVSRPEESDEDWDGLTGRIDEAMIKNLVDNISKQTFWICGPPKMVDGMEELMDKLNVSIGQVNTEKFSGY